MALAVPLTELARGRVQLKLSISDGNAILLNKPSSSSLVTPLPPSDLQLHFTSSKEDDSLLVTMWATTRSQCDGKAEPPCWNWQQDEYEEKAYLEQQISSLVGPLDPYKSPAMDNNNYFQLPTPPSELDNFMNRSEYQLPDAFSPVDVFSPLDGMGWPEFSSGFQVGAEVLPDMSLQQSFTSYLPPSPDSDINPTNTSYGMSQSSPQMPVPVSTPSSSYTPAQSSSSYLSTPALTTSAYSPPSTNQEESISSARSDLSDSSTAPPVSPPASEGNALRPHPCLFPDCGRWFTRSYTRNVHMLTHRRSNDPKPFVCTIPGCSEGFSRKHDRLRHEVRQHGRGSNWRCPLCPLSKFYSSQSTLERHLSEKHNESRPG